MEPSIGRIANVQPGHLTGDTDSSLTSIELSAPSKIACVAQSDFSRFAGRQADQTQLEYPFSIKCGPKKLLAFPFRGSFFAYMGQPTSNCPLDKRETKDRGSYELAIHKAFEQFAEE